MTEAMLAAIVSALGGFLPSTGLLLWEIRKHRETRRLLSRKDSEIETAAEEAVNAVTSAEYFPYTSDSIVVSVKILNGNGDSITEKQVRGLKVRQGLVIQSIDGYFETTGRFRTDWRPLLVSRSRSDIDLIGDFVSDQRFNYAIRFHGELSHSDAPVDFAFRFSTEGGYLLDRSRISNAYGTDSLPCEYFSEIIQAPVGRLQMLVTFPTDLSVPTFASVTFGGSRAVAYNERRRIEQDFSNIDSRVLLTVDAPKLGHTYLICWSGIEITGPRDSSANVVAQTG